MAKKHLRTSRCANVAVPLDGAWFLRRFSEAVGGSLSREFALATSSGWVPREWDLDPRVYDDADSFRRDYQLSVMLSKFDDEKSSERKASLAIEKFLAAEEQCRQTNDRFNRFVGGSLVNDLSVEAVLFTAQRKIARLLGDLDLDEIASGFGFGPGASTRLSRRQSDAWYKFQGKPETTINNSVFATAVFQQSPLWKETVLVESESPLPFRVVQGNRVVTVPKNAKIDRVIAIEPDLNLFVQKGFGAVIRKRLKKVGIDLNDQTVNQSLAHIGSLDGSLATIDLSSASDMISYQVVRSLMPPDWLQALEQCRSQEGVLTCDNIIRYHKFSSMGNGFTFELESLLFWALCSSVLDLIGEKDRRMSVYGDDIIVPVTSIEPVIGILTFCGFAVNAKKSYWDGPFRESCGKHYFHGVDVTPFYVRSQPRRLNDVFLLHNSVVRWSHHSQLGYRRDYSGLGMLCQDLRNVAPANWRRPRVPLGYGDGAFVGSFDEVLPHRSPRGLCGWLVEVLVEPRRVHHRGGYGALLKSLWGLERGRHDLSRGHYLGIRSVQSHGLRAAPIALLRGHGSEISDLLEPVEAGIGSRVPGSVRAKVQKTLVPQWAELGPWL